MGKLSVEQVFNGSLSTVSVSSYDPTKINLPNPQLINQWSLGADPPDKFIGPAPCSVLRLFENTGISGFQALHVVRQSTNNYWIFGGDASTAANTRRIFAYTYNLATNSSTYLGFITLTPNAALTGNNTLRALRAFYRGFTTGTVTVSGTAVTGVGTTWTASRLAAGSRIGFGSTDPTAITTWFEIGTIVSDTSITLTATAGTIAAGTPYVIEDLRILTTWQNGTTATNGGVFLAKGLRLELFTIGGTVINGAVATDNVRALYRLADAGSITNTTPNGAAAGDFVSFTDQSVYVGNGAATSLIVFRYNIRAALTVSAGSATLSGADLTVTGAQAVTGNLVATANGRVGTFNHAPSSGIPSLFLATATRLLRIALSGITTGSTTFVSDQMTEVVLGGASTSSITGAIQNLDVASSIDRILYTGFANNISRLVVSQYRTDAGQPEQMMLSINAQIDQGSSVGTPYPHVIAAAFQVWTEDGILFMCPFGGTTATTTIGYIIPGFGAHWTYANATLQRAILPKITLGALPSKFYRVLIQEVPTLGSGEQAKPLDPVRVLYRTGSTIDDNSGAWTLAPANGDLSGVSVSTAIQFALEFRTMTDLALPGRVTSLALIFESADALPSQYQWNFGDSSSTDSSFGFVQVNLFGGSPTVHTISIFRADTNALVLTQASSGTTNGVFEFWNGSAWVSGLSTDVIGTRRRFRPTGSLPSGVDLYARISVA